MANNDRKDVGARHVFMKARFVAENMADRHVDWIESNDQTRFVMISNLGSSLINNEKDRVRELVRARCAASRPGQTCWKVGALRPDSRSSAPDTRLGAALLAGGLR